MENGAGNEAVGTIMADALAVTARPGEILTRVSAMVAPKSGADLGGRKRKLTPAQAARAAACVTSMMVRLGVRPRPPAGRPAWRPRRTTSTPST